MVFMLLSLFFPHFKSICLCLEKDEVIRVRDCVKICSAEGQENVGKIMFLHYDESSSWYFFQGLNTYLLLAYFF